MSSVCRACGHYEKVDKRLHRCPACGSPRLTSHSELGNLNIAHIDCDAFYASVEKRDNPELKDKPVIVGGGKRGVVSACCYIARLKRGSFGDAHVSGQQTMPNATIIRPRMEKYRRIGQAIREMMLEKTPLVEPLSIDGRF